jgi:predicted AlkP superfamily pyrophosphatase or phosphodiesterase
MKLNSNNKKAKLKNHMVSKYLHVVFFLNIFVSCKFTTIQCAQFNTNPKLLFISFDGFRWDYLTKYNLPNFNYLKSIGSHADFIYSSFATSTFPNHWTLVTGI